MNWAELLDRLRGNAGLSDRDLAATEKRKSWRVFHKIPLKAYGPREVPLELVATNFGPTGMRAETSQRLKKDDELRVEVERPGLPPDHFRVRVVWCRRRKDDGQHEVGVRFVDDAANNKLSAARFLLEECNLSIQNPREQRKAPRVQASRMAAVIATDDGEVSQAQVVDLSIGGVQLLSARRVPRGANLDLKITLAADLPALLCKGIVVRSSAEGLLRTSDLAVAFTEVPPDHKERLVSFLARLLRS